MEELLDQLRDFNSVTTRETLQIWARQTEQEIENLDMKERAFYYLVLSEFQVIYLRDIDLGYETLKKIQLSTALLTQQVKVRRCFYKYLQGAYEFALENLQDIINANSNPCSQKIAIDFFSRILFKDIYSSFGKSKRKMQKIESYQSQYLKAINQQRAGLFKIAREIHTSLFNKFESINETIRYESSKHILMLFEKEKAKPNREEMQKYMDVITGFERGIKNKNYYKMKVNYLNNLLEFIDPEKERENDMLIDFQVAKTFIVSSIEAAISKQKNSQNRQRLRAVLDDLKKSKEIAQQICYKFIGDKLYEKLLQQSQRGQDKSKLKGKQSRYEKKNISQIDQQHYKLNQKSRIISPPKKNKLKDTESRYDDRSANPQFTGSIMTKVNMNSGGFQDRYFYMKDDFKSTMKLYYCSKREKQSGSDDYYRLKGLKKINFGKKSDAFKRSECQQFQEDRCFTLYISSDETYQRNFYVKQQDDYNNWVAIFQGYLRKKQYDSNTKKTKLIIP